MTERAVVVTTAHRGVFFGYLNGDYKPGDAVLHLQKARNILYWPQENRGFMGLASMGPKKGSRVGPPVSTIELREITSVIACNDSAAQAFELAPWAK